MSRGTSPNIKSDPRVLALVLVLSTSATAQDSPQTVVYKYVAAANLGDVDAQMALYADDASLTIKRFPGPGVPPVFTLTGKNALRGLALRNAEVHSNTRIMEFRVEGNLVTETDRVEWDLTRALNLPPLTTKVETVVEAGKIKSQVVSIDAAGSRRVVAAISQFSSGLGARLQAENADGLVMIGDSDKNVNQMHSDEATIFFKKEALPELPRNKVYEGWLIAGNRKESTGLLRPVPGPEGTFRHFFSLRGEEQSITIKLDEQNNSGQSGTATLTASGNQTEVVLSVTPGPAAGDPQPVHIHFRSCGGAALGGVDYPLTAVTAGKSTTTVDATLRSIMDGNHAINLHKSVPEVAVYTACGKHPRLRPAHRREPDRLLRHLRHNRRARAGY